MTPCAWANPTAWQTCSNTCDEPRQVGRRVGRSSSSAARVRPADQLHRQERAAVGQLARGRGPAGCPGAAAGPVIRASRTNRPAPRRPRRPASSTLTATSRSRAEVAGGVGPRPSRRGRSRRRRRTRPAAAAGRPARRGRRGRRRRWRPGRRRGRGRGWRRRWASGELRVDRPMVTRPKTAGNGRASVQRKFVCSGDMCAGSAPPPRHALRSARVTRRGRGGIHCPNPREGTRR